MAVIPSQIQSNLTELLNSTEQFIALFDDTDRLVYANACFRATFGLQADETPQWIDMMRASHAKGIGVKIDTNDIDSWLISTQSRRAKVPFRTIECDLVDGRWVFWVETTQANGWMLCIATDVSNMAIEKLTLKSSRDLAHKLALTDELTGLGNRRFVMESLQGLLAEPDEITPLVVAMIDLDHFKQINDVYGHACGDAVLKHFSSVLQTLSRRDDLIGRLGGEEFLLVLPGANTTIAARVLGRILSEVRKSTPIPNMPEVKYTCSAGVTVVTSNDEVNSLLHRADQALYKAKSLGRDQFVVDEGRAPYV